MTCALYKAQQCAKCDGEQFYYPECPANEQFSALTPEVDGDDDTEESFEEVAVRCPSCGQKFRVTEDRVVQQ